MTSSRSLTLICMTKQHTNVPARQRPSPRLSHAPFTISSSFDKECTLSALFLFCALQNQLHRYRDCCSCLVGRGCRPVSQPEAVSVFHVGRIRVSAGLLQNLALPKLYRSTLLLIHDHRASENHTALRTSSIVTPRRVGDCETFS